MPDKRGQMSWDEEQDMRLDSLALVRSKLENDDELFLTITNSLTERQMVALLSMTASLASVIIEEFIDKLHAEVPEHVEPDFTPSSYVASMIERTILLEPDRED